MVGDAKNSIFNTSTTCIYLVVFQLFPLTIYPVDHDVIPQSTSPVQKLKVVAHARHHHHRYRASELDNMPKRLLTKTVGCMTPHKTTNGSKLPASSHCKRTPMRISFGPSSSDSEGESDSDSGSNASEVVAPCRSTAAAGGEGGRVVSLTERLQVRKEVESSSGCKNGASDVPSKAPPSSRAPAAVPNLRTPLLSVGNIDTQNSRYSNSSNSNNNSLVGASVDNRSLKRRDGAALGKGFSRERSISIRTSSPRCVINALDGVNDAATTCATAMDNSIDLSRSSELEDHRSVSSSPSLSPPSQHWQSSSQSARKRNSINNVEGSSSAGRFSCQSNMSGGGNARLYPASTTPVAVSRAFHSPSNVPFTNMVDSIDLTGVGSDSENQRSPGGKLPKHTRNGRQGGSAGGVEKIGAVAASATMACRRGGGRYSIDSVSSVDLVVDENDGADGRYAGKNNDDDNFVFEDCHGDEVRRESDNEGNPGVASYHSSQSSDNSSILSKSSRKKGANGRSEFSVVPAPRISMGAAAAAAAAGSGRGSRYDGGGEACDWRPAAAGSSRWELEAEGGNGTPFSVPASLYDRMYPHQREGVKWLWRLHQEETGGILGDDMGLGKTFQVTKRPRKREEVENELSSEDCSIFCTLNLE